MDDLALVAAFESTELDGNAFTHVEHVRVAWHYLRTLPLGEAIDRCRDGIRRFAATKGAAGKYHETVTVAFLLVPLKFSFERPRTGGRAALRNSTRRAVDLIPRQDRGALSREVGIRLSPRGLE